MSGIDLPPAPWLLLIGALVALLLAALAGWWRAATRAARASRARQRRARRAETEAERFLESLGYVVLERQVTRNWRMEISWPLRERRGRRTVLRRLGRLLPVRGIRGIRERGRKRRAGRTRALAECFCGGPPGCIRGL